MIEFIKSFWQFIIAGIIVLALIAYWVVESVLAKKKKEKEFLELEQRLAQEEAEQAAKAQDEAKKAKNKKGKKQTVKKVADDEPILEEIVLEDDEKQPVEEKPVKEKRIKEKPVKEKQPVEEVVVEEVAVEEKSKTMGAYMISYDKAKKDWVIKRKGAQRATKRTKTKKEALDIVKDLTEKNEVGYVVKKKDGKFQKK